MAVTSLTGTFPSTIPVSYGSLASRGGNFVTFAGNNVSSATVWEVHPDGSVTERPILHSGGALTVRLNTVAISKDGTYIVEVPYNDGSNPVVLKWNATNNRYEFLVALTGPGGYQTVADFSEDDSLLVVGGWNGIRVFSRSGDTFTFIQELPNNSSYINGAQVEGARFSHNGQYLALAHRTGIQVYLVSGWSRIYDARSDKSIAGWGVAWSLDDTYIASTCTPIGSGFYVWSISGSTVTWLNAMNPIWNVASGSPAIAIRTSSGDYFMVVEGNATTDSQVRFYEQSTGFTTYKTMADLGFPSLTGSQSWYMAGSGIAADGYQYVYSMKSGAPNAQGWRIDPLTPPGIDINGAVTAPMAEVAATLAITFSINGELDAPMAQVSGAVDQDEATPGEFSIPHRAVGLTLDASGYHVETETPLPFVYGDVTVPMAQVAASAFVGTGAFGGITAPMAEVAGLLISDFTINGELDAPMAQVSGSLFVGFSLTGAVDAPMAEVAATLAQDQTATGELDAPMAEVEGVLSYIQKINGELDAPMAQVSGSLLFGILLNGAADAPMAEIEATASVGYLVRGAVDAPMAEADGALEQDLGLWGDVTAPMAEVESTLAFRYNIDCNITAPMAQIAATVKMTNGLRGGVDAPMAQVAAVVRLFNNMTGELDAPMAEVEGVVKLINFVHGDVDAPMAEVEGSLEQPLHINGGIDAPMAEVEGVFKITIDVTGSVDAPMAEVAAIIDLRSFVNGELDAPMAEVAGSLAQDVELNGELDAPMAEVEGAIDWDLAIFGAVDAPMAEASGTLGFILFVEGAADAPMAEVAALIKLSADVSGGATAPLAQVEAFVYVGDPPEPGEGGTGMGTSGGGTIGAPSFRFGQGNRTRIG